MPASVIAESPTISRPDRRPDAAHGRADDDGFGAALGAAASSRTLPAHARQSASTRPATPPDGRPPAGPASTRTASPAAPRPAAPSPDTSAATGPAPASPGDTASGDNGSDPAAQLAANVPLPDTTNGLPVAPPDANAVAAGVLSRPLPAPHGTAGTPSSARRTEDDDDTPEPAVQASTADPAATPLPTPLPVAPLPDPLTQTAAGGVTDPVVAAAAGTTTSVPAPTGLVAADAAAGPGSAATPPAAAPDSAPSTPDNLVARTGFATALQADTRAQPLRRPSAPAPAAARIPSGTATGSAALPSASRLPEAAPPQAAAAGTVQLHPAGTPQAGARTPAHPASADLATAAAGTVAAPDGAAQPATAQPGAPQTLVPQMGDAQIPVLLTAQPGPSATPPATPAPAPLATAAPLPGTPAAQVVPAMLAMHTANGAQNMMLRLTPAELGTVQVQITRDRDGAASVSVLVERPETLRLLLHDQAQLQHALSQAGLPSDRTLSLQQAPPGSFASHEGAASTRDFGQGGAGSGASGNPAQGGRDGGARQGFAGDGDARPGSSRAAPGLRSYASAWQPAGIDITA